MNINLVLAYIACCVQNVMYLELNVSITDFAY